MRIPTLPETFSIIILFSVTTLVFCAAYETRFCKPPGNGICAFADRLFLRGADALDKTIDRVN